MRHLFWIISGTVLVALLVTWFIIVPTDEARASKTKLDQQSKELNQLEQRADRGDPQGVFDAENAADTQRLADEYLITGSWLQVLNPHVVKYEKQLADIRTQLLGRGNWLSKSVAPTSNVLEWYSAYIAASEALVARLREAGCLKRAPEDEEKSASGESPTTVRLSAGLYTKSGSFPEPREHPQLTSRLRAMEMITDRLIAARIAIADSPVVGPTGRSDDRARSSAMIGNVEWVGGGMTVGSEAAGGLRPLATAVRGQLQARSLGLRLTLNGSVSALLAVSAALERNADADRPLIAITAANLGRRENGLAGERYDVAGDSAQLVLSVEVITFAESTGETPIDANGMPGGMPSFPGMMPPGAPGGPPPFLEGN